MRELLFESLVEKEALENLLALNQIKKCDNIINKYESEIEEQKNEMIKILKNEDIDETYIEKINKYKNIIHNMDDEIDKINQLEIEIKNNEERINEFQEKILEIEKNIENLKKEIFDATDPSKVIECQNELDSENERLNDLNDILTGLISDNTPLLIEKEYLSAKNTDFDFNIPSYQKEDISNDLDQITLNFNESFEKLDLPVRENIEFCQKKIKNRELEIEKYNNRKNCIIEEYPNAINLDINKTYEELNNLLNELGLFKELNKVEEKNMFDEEEDETYNIPIEEEIESSLVENKEEDTLKEEVNEEIKEEENKNEDIESVSYELSDGESLALIAEKVYPSKDDWEAIYYFNKENIDRYLISNGISNDFETIKELAEDTSLFAGLKLEIPTDYNYRG